MNNINENNHDELKGDTIGDTAYSQSFALQTLMQVVNMEEIEAIENFVEKHLCILWDMTAEKEVVEFLMKHKSMEILSHALNTSENSRLTEVIIGIIANMCCFPEVIIELHKKNYTIKIVLEHLPTENPVVIVQVMRFIFSNVYHDSGHYDSWLKHLELNNFNSVIKFILRNSSNESVLFNVLETINCICSAYNADCDTESFIRLFVEEEFINATRIGFEEFIKCNHDTGKKEEVERCEIIYLAMYSVLTGFGTQSVEAFTNELPNILKIINQIIEKHMENNSDALVDIVEYTTAILSTPNSSNSNEAIDLFSNMLIIWKRASSHGAQSTNNISDFECSNELDLSTKHMMLMNILPQYFVRFLSSISREQSFQLLKNVETYYLTLLNNKIEELISTDQMDRYFSEICSLLNTLPSTIAEENESD